MRKKEKGRKVGREGGAKEGRERERKKFKSGAF